MATDISPAEFEMLTKTVASLTKRVLALEAAAGVTDADQAVDAAEREFAQRRKFADQREAARLGARRGLTLRVTDDGFEKRLANRVERDKGA